MAVQSIAMERFIEQFFEDRPPYIERVKALENKRGLNLIGKLSKEKNEINFASWRSEVAFGLFFDKGAETVEFERRIEGKTPDWTVHMNGEKFIAEVLRINTPEEELLISMEKTRVINDALREHPDASFMDTSNNAKVLSSQYFYGHQHKVERKENSYRDIINKHKLPFVICIESTRDTFVDGLDTFDAFIGSTKRGLFYKNDNLRKNVTGVLLYTYFGQFVYFHNELALNQFNQSNLNYFNSIHYKEN